VPPRRQSSNRSKGSEKFCVDHGLDRYDALCGASVFDRYRCSEIRKQGGTNGTTFTCFVGFAGISQVFRRCAKS
jgi:hypothetical protein